MAPPFASAHYRPNRAETPVRASPALAGKPLLLFGRVIASVDLGLQHIGRLEHHDSARKNWHFDAGLRIAPDPLALGADDERAEARQLDRFAARSRVADFVQNRLHQFRRLRARQSNFLINNFGQVCPRDRLSGFAPKSRFVAKSSVRHFEPQTIPASRATSSPTPRRPQTSARGF